MRAYIGTKTLTARALTLGSYNLHRNWTMPADEDPERLGYHVVYDDGYESWTPEEAFNGAYQPLDGMSFGHAVEMLKRGKKVSRSGWNGAGMFVFLVPGSRFTVNRAPLLGIYPEGTVIDYRAHIDLKTAQGDVATWVPSISDVLADDWAVVG